MVFLPCNFYKSIKTDHNDNVLYPPHTDYPNLLSLMDYYTLFAVTVLMMKMLILIKISPLSDYN